MIQCGLFPASPHSPQTAFSIDLLDFYGRLFERASLPIRATAAALADFHGDCGQRYLQKFVRLPQWQAASELTPFCLPSKGERCPNPFDTLYPPQQDITIFSVVNWTPLSPPRFGLITLALDLPQRLLVLGLMLLPLSHRNLPKARQHSPLFAQLLQFMASLCIRDDAQTASASVAQRVLVGMSLGCRRNCTFFLWVKHTITC